MSGSKASCSTLCKLSVSRDFRKKAINTQGSNKLIKMVNNMTFMVQKKNGTSGSALKGIYLFFLDYGVRLNNIKNVPKKNRYYGVGGRVRSIHARKKW